MLPVYLSVSLDALAVISFVALTTYRVMTFWRWRRDRRTDWPWLGPFLMSVAMLIYFGRRLYFRLPHRDPDHSGSAVLGSRDAVDGCWFRADIS